MSQASALTANHANFGTEARLVNRRRALRLNEQVMQTSRGFWPVKTALHLSEITGYSTRAAENWLSGKVVIPTDALAALMQSEQGREFLACVMTDYTPRWWTTLRSFLNRITKEEQLARAEREYREVLDEQATKSGPHTYEVSDPLFHEDRMDPRRPLASKKRNGR